MWRHVRLYQKPEQEQALRSVRRSSPAWHGHPHVAPQPAPWQSRIWPSAARSAALPHCKCCRPLGVDGTRFTLLQEPPPILINPLEGGARSLEREGKGG